MMTVPFEDVPDLLSKRNPVFRTFLFYSAVLSIKILAVALFTGYKRFKYKIFANPEDTCLVKGSAVNLTHPEIERVRRAHLNDLENILPFFIVSILYILTNPNEYVATNLIRVFAISRIVHTIVYTVVVIPQPARGIAYEIGNIINWYMAIRSLYYFI